MAFIVATDISRIGQYEAITILIKTNVWFFQVYAINGAGAGPKIQLKITMDIKGMSIKDIVSEISIKSEEIAVPPMITLLCALSYYLGAT